MPEKRGLSGGEQSHGTYSSSEMEINDFIQHTACSKIKRDSAGKIT